MATASSTSEWLKNHTAKQLAFCAILGIDPDLG
jgi:hypothetical protein